MHPYSIGLLPGRSDGPVPLLVTPGTRAGACLAALCLLAAGAPGPVRSQPIADENRAVASAGYSIVEEDVGSRSLAAEGLFPAVEELVRALGWYREGANRPASHAVHGPDGKVYFVIKEPRDRRGGPEIHERELPDAASVYRCRMDGGSLELVATGLRNPQALAFDRVGNLFAVDWWHGEEGSGRLVQVLEGGDGGWRHGFTRGARGWELLLAEEGLTGAGAGRPSQVIPPLIELAPGAQTVVADPRWRLTETGATVLWIGHALRERSESGIQSYTLRTRGAGLELAESHTVVRGLRPERWERVGGPGLRIEVTAEGGAAAGAETRRSLLIHSTTLATEEDARLGREGQRTLTDLNPGDVERLKALGHSDDQIRASARRAWVALGEPAVAVLQSVAEQKEEALLVRLQALWCLGQLADRVPGALNGVGPLMTDPEAEVRAQACKVVGDTGRIEAFSGLREALRDPAPRVVFFAAQSLGKLRRPDAIPALIDALRRNDDQDLWLRHAVVVAMARLGAESALASWVKDPSRAVRRGVMLAHRRTRSAAVAEFLDDIDTGLASEAARAIHDESIDAARPALAARMDTMPLDDVSLVLRVLDAQLRLGAPEGPRLLAEFAARPHVPARFRAEALRLLSAWAEPPAHDGVIGAERSRGSRDVAPARQALGDFLVRMSGQTPEAVQVATIQAVARLKIPGTGHALWDVVYQETRPIPTRVAALQALESLDDLRLEVAAQHAARARQVELRLAAIPVLGRRHPAVSLPLLGPLARNGTVAEQRAVYTLLATMTDARADALCLDALRRLEAGDVPRAAQVELLETVERRGGSELAPALTRLKEAWARDADRLAPWRGALEGGNAEAGRERFLRHGAGACGQCHASDLNPRPGSANTYASDGVGDRLNREQVLTRMLHLEGPTEARRASADLTLREARDLVAYLAGLRSPPGRLHPSWPSQPERSGHGASGERL